LAAGGAAALTWLSLPKRGSWFSIGIYTWLSADVRLPLRRRQRRPLSRWWLGDREVDDPDAPPGPVYRAGDDPERVVAGVEMGTGGAASRDTERVAAREDVRQRGERPEPLAALGPEVEREARHGNERRDGRRPV